MSKGRMEAFSDGVIAILAEGFNITRF